METVITHKVDSHHTNANYRCLLIPVLQLKEFHLVIDWQRMRIVKCDFMPTEDFALELDALLCDISPTFPERLLAQAVNIRPKRVVSKRKIERLEDVLF